MKTKETLIVKINKLFKEKKQLETKIIQNVDEIINEHLNLEEIKTDQSYALIYKKDNKEHKEIRTLSMKATPAFIDDTEDIWETVFYFYRIETDNEENLDGDGDFNLKLKDIVKMYEF